MNPQFSKEKIQVTSKCMKKLFNLLSSHRNANQNYTEGLSHTSQSGSQHNNKWLYTAGYNVNSYVHSWNHSGGFSQNSK